MLGGRLQQYLGKRIPASDIYPLGVIGIECLLGRIPQELREAVEKTQPFVVKPSTTIPKPLAVILTKMVARSSGERYQDGQALLTALRQAEESIVKNSALQAKPGLLVRGVQALWRGLSHAWRARRGEDGYISGAATTTQIDNHQAVAGKITVKGQQLDTLLTEGSFNKTRNDQIAYARSLGYRLATRKEHLVYIKGLLAKQADNTINDAEKNALKTYRDRFVRDTKGGLAVVGWRVRGDGYDWHGRGFPDCGALFVRASAESKLFWSSIIDFLIPSARRGWFHRSLVL